MKTIYLAGYNSDTTEGRGPTVYVAAFASREDAEAACLDLPGVFGTKNTTKPKEMVMYNSYEEWAEKHHEAELRRKALAKLTDEEMRALGLGDP